MTQDIVQRPVCLTSNNKMKALIRRIKKVAQTGCTALLIAERYILSWLKVNFLAMKRGPLQVLMNVKKAVLN